MLRHPITNLFRELSSDITEASTPFDPQSLANFNMIGNYTPGSPGIFAIKCPEVITVADLAGNVTVFDDNKYEIYRVLIKIQDNVSNSEDEYISNAPLTNGIIASLNTSYGSQEIIHDPIKNYSDWSTYAGVDVVNIAKGNSSGKTWAVRWSIDKSGQPTTLRGSNPVENGLGGVDRGEEIIVKLQDNFSSLLKQVMIVQGVIRFGRK
jgi:hypothetical protein